MPRIGPGAVPRLNTLGGVKCVSPREEARAEAARCLARGICSECESCVRECGVNAIDLNMRASERKLEIGAVVMAPGYKTYQAELAEEYGLGRYPNVLSSLPYERLL